MARELKVTIDEIRDVLAGLIEGVKSREEAARWANRLRNKNDRNQLHYVPPQHENLIKECITYLSGVDMKEHADDDYLHLKDDFRDFYLTRFHN